MALASVPVGDYRITRGIPALRRSSDFGWRSFCPDCGTPLTMQVSHQPDTIDFTIVTLDAPGEVAPGFHIWAGSRVGWFETADDAPRHEGFRSDTRGMNAQVAGGAGLPGVPAGSPD